MLAALFGMVVNPAWAVPISADLSLSGSVQFDITDSDPAEGGASQSATLNLTSGGSASSSSVDSALAVTGSNPLSGNFTETGDGVGMVLANSGTGGTLSDPVGSANFGGDYSISLTNNSATDSYDVVLRIAYNHSVDADGSDAYAAGEMVFDEAPIDLTELFFSDLVSDTFFGDEVGGSLTGTYGDPQGETGSLLLTFSLNPSTSLILVGTQDLEGGSFASDSSYSGLLDVFISVDSVTNTTRPPSPTIPIPGVLPLLGLGLLVLGLRRNDRRGVCMAEP
jgi:MYXO-CTERM domain-containing protein